MAQTYTYSISADCPGAPNGKVNIGNLRREILASAIASAALQDIRVDGNVLSIVFSVALSAGDKTILDNDTTGPAGGLIAANVLRSLSYTQPSLDQVPESPTGMASEMVLPGVTPYLGSFAGWNNVAQVKRNDVFYGRMWLSKGTFIGCEYIMGESKAGEANFAVYADDGGSPPRPTGSYLAWGKSTLPGVATKHRVLFTANLTLALSGYYWIAFKMRANDVNVASCSNKYEHSWGDVLFAYKGGYGDVDIGALAGFDANADTALPYFALVREGAPA